MNIDINALTKEQLKAVRDQLKAAAAERKAERGKWTEIVDAMLHAKDDGSEFSYTTVDIWTSLYEAGLEELDPAETDDQDQRDSVLKRIQARKQVLVKAGHDVGYKAAPKTAVTNYNFNNVIAWLKRTELTQDQLIALGEIVDR